MKVFISLKKSFIFALVFLLIFPGVVLGNDDVEQQNVELGESVLVEGELSEPEFNTLAAHSNVGTLSGPTKVKNFVRYLTSSWAQASSYTWSQSQSVSSSVSSSVGMTAGAISNSLGVSNSVTTTYSVAITIPANNSRFSKLAFYSDFDERYVRVRLWNTQGILYSDKNTYHYAPRKDTYLQVVYQ